MSYVENQQYYLFRIFNNEPSFEQLRTISHYNTYIHLCLLCQLVKCMFIKFKVGRVEEKKTSTALTFKCDKSTPIF
jgi:hypothetical protein